MWNMMLKRLFNTFIKTQKAQVNFVRDKRERESTIYYRGYT